MAVLLKMGNIIRGAKERAKEMDIAMLNVRMHTHGEMAC